MTNYFYQHTHTHTICCCSYYLLNFMKAILEMEFNGEHIFSSMTNIIFEIYGENSRAAISTDSVLSTVENSLNSFPLSFSKKRKKKHFMLAHIFPIVWCWELETYHFQSIFVLCAANLFLCEMPLLRLVCEWKICIIFREMKIYSNLLRRGKNAKKNTQTHNLQYMAVRL